jgi:hypothetical protein
MALGRTRSSALVTALTCKASGTSIHPLRSGNAPAKTTERSEALDFISVPVGKRVESGLGRGVISGD